MSSLSSLFFPGQKSSVTFGNISEILLLKFFRNPLSLLFFKKVQIN